MKFITFINSCGETRAGWLHDNKIVDMNLASQGKLPSDLGEFLKNYYLYKPILDQVNQTNPAYSQEEVLFMAPIPNPPSYRDFMAFETHVQNAAKRHGNGVPPEWYEIPVFYFGNHRTLVGHNQPVRRPDKCKCLDYELEIACIIGKEGTNIKANEAEAYIFGYTILNDWSARDLQAKEMKVMLGPAKGKDFATSMGPYLVSKDEMEAFRLEGDRYDLEMTAKVNGKVLSKGNFKDIYHSFAQMIERASEDVTLYPGDVIGSGTVGFGCILELGTDVHRWLEPGDVVELEITGLGKLVNRII